MKRAVLNENYREKIRKLLVTGDNRLKQGVDPEKARESFLQALEAARKAGLEDEVRPLVEIRLADLERLAGGSPPPEPPADCRRARPQPRRPPRSGAGASRRSAG